MILEFFLILKKNFQFDSVSYNLPSTLASSLFVALGFSYTRMSSRVTEKAENNVDLQSNLQEGQSSYSYEAAMEALSSLITRQKRADRTPVGGKYGKLERMSEYLKVPFFITQ